MRVNQLASNQAVLPSLTKAGIHTVEQLEFKSGVELYATPPAVPAARGHIA